MGASSRSLTPSSSRSAGSRWRWWARAAISICSTRCTSYRSAAWRDQTDLRGARRGGKWELRAAGLLLCGLTVLAQAKETVGSIDFGRLVGLQIQCGAARDASAKPELRLTGADAREQLLVNGQFSGGRVRDFTRDVRYQVVPGGVVQVDPTGWVVPLANGKATITARCKEGLSAALPVVVERLQAVVPVNFANQIVPIFTKLGCNGGGCHGKASGQNGFRLSLLGFEPAEDYEHLVKEARGRRLFPAAPEHSLILLKATATLPHGGGRRLDTNSMDYRLLVRWIAQGMPYGNATDPTVDRIEVSPEERTMPLNGGQQLAVIAHYTDGSVEDVTRGALFEANDKNLATVDGNGWVKVFAQPGDVAVMVRYQAKVAVFRATLPLGAPVEHLPTPRNFIDELVFKKLKAVGMPPSDSCDDATFVRRVGLDITGRLPTPAETKAFLADRDAAKRDRWIDRLLGRPDYADYFADDWSALLRNKRSRATQARGTYAFHDWIRDSLLVNKPYDRFVREILTASGSVEQDPPVAWYHQVRDPNAELEDAAQLFLGTRLKCAECHHHPFEKWSQRDYYRFAAFFSQIGRKPGPQPDEEVIYHRRGNPTALNKKTQQPEKPAGLGDAPLDLSPDDDARQALADWMTSKRNPFFARALVNRYWKHFFGRGLVEPDDDLRETNPATDPELLDALAKYFIDRGYDLEDLVRTICQSRTYQLSSLPNVYNVVDKQYFSRYYPKRLTAEVLYDAVNQVTRSDSAFEGLPRGTRAVQLPDDSYNASSYFLAVFGRPDDSSACDCERSQDASLAQSLHLLNAKEIEDKLTSDQGRPHLLANDQTRGDDAKLRELYLWAYSREPNASELAAARRYLDKESAAKPAVGRRLAYEDICWALINTKEFLFNH
ncbi:MAG: DUF1553 domain-containing protein [Verrucomicrobia bacterium]|nr:DUF1553 domain-containing protein [Verrucomicrobiota bacterium]